jgi:hypothetical protein
MHPLLIQFLGVFGIGLGCYLLLGLVIPRFRGRSWSKDPASLVAVCAAFSILLGLFGLGVARPYTWIAAIAVLSIGYVILARDRETIAFSKRLLKHRGFIVVFFLVNLIVIALCFFLA